MSGHNQEPSENGAATLAATARRGSHNRAAWRAEVCGVERSAHSRRPQRGWLLYAETLHNPTESSSSFFPRRIGSLLTAMLVLVLVPCGGGCAGYRWGQRTLYRPDVQTVHVPIFQSDSFRRNLGERLTEAVVKEIQLKTPYRLAPAESADSVLRGRIISETKDVVAEDYYDLPRVLQTDLMVQIDWTGRQGNLLTNAVTVPLPDYLLHIGQGEQLIPEGGQSIATAQQQAIEQLAEQIVAQMEMAPW